MSVIMDKQYFIEVLNIVIAEVKKGKSYVTITMEDDLTQPTSQFDLDSLDGFVMLVYFEDIFQLDKEKFKKFNESKEAMTLESVFEFMQTFEFETLPSIEEITENL
jgi:hypothetical protein